MKIKKDNFDKYACELKNEADCEEELEEEGLELETADEEHFDEEEQPYKEKSD